MIITSVSVPPNGFPTLEPAKIPEDQQQPEELGYQQLTDLSTAKGLTVPGRTRYVIVHVEGEVVRWRDDGTNPTASSGMRLPVGGEFRYEGKFSAIKFIQETPTAKVNVYYFA